MLSTFVFTFFISIQGVVSVRSHLGIRHVPAHVAKITLRSPLDDASFPLPGLQVSEHNSRSGSSKQPALLDVGHEIIAKKHRWTPWSPFSTQNPTSIWSHPGVPGKLQNQQGGVQYPYEALANNSTFNSSGLKHPDPKNRSALAAAARYENFLANPSNGTPIIVALAGGTGASIGGTGSINVDRDLLRRMHYQDKAVMLLVLVVYMVALAFSVNLTYRQASNNSPVSYYADPRFHNLGMEGHDLDVFLDTFNQTPKNISLRVAGFVPVSDDMDGNVQWRGENFQTAFTFSLDLSPWMVRETQMIDRSGSLQHTRSLHDGVLPEDRSSLNYMLSNDSNDLGYVEIIKHVKWPDWEELATNIKHQIRQSGFNGVISVDRGHTDELQIYKNRAWANFMHARATRVLCALSIFGWLIYVPYMWLRCKAISVRSFYRVDVEISEYWPLISEQLTADGFAENRPLAVSNSA